jgi:hypothetical protein
LLVPIFLMLTIYSFTTWVISIASNNPNASYSFQIINYIFFEQFFTILIFADVLILLFSFFITDEFHKVIRNSGFITSTILIRISFTTSGLSNNILVIYAILFGLVILIIHNKYENKIFIQKKQIQ